MIITGYTAERMQEIEDGTVVSGRIDPALGNLILTRHDGTEIDAGSAIPIVPLASDTIAGRIELATNAETQAGTAVDRAVTPAGIFSLPGWRLIQILVFSSSGTFAKASYPGMKGARVRCVGGGGGGGGANTAGAGNHSVGGGGGGGGYAETLLAVASLGASETITVGAGGSAGAIGTNGGTGGTSSFGTLVAANGGAGGGILTNNAGYVSAVGGAGGVGATGTLKTSGSPGGYGTGNATLAIGGIGGSSLYGGGGPGAVSTAAAAVAGAAGSGYGGGGAGALVNQNASGTTGGAGSSGLVFVEVYG